MKALLEVCVGDVASLQAACTAGAERIELCCALEAGGLTPTEAFVRRAVEADGPKVNVLVRPRSGDFVYSDEEAAIIADEIAMCRRAGANGVVIGALRPDGSVDVERMKRWCDAAEGMDITFHRAFDMCRDMREAVDTLRPLVNRILTSGMHANAWEGRHIIRDLAAYTGSHICIMPGGGITPDNILPLLAETGVKELHGTFSAPLSSSMEFRRMGVSMSASGTDEFTRPSTSLTILQRALDTLR